MNQVKTAELVRSWQSPERSRFFLGPVAAAGFLVPIEEPLQTGLIWPIEELPRILKQVLAASNAERVFYLTVYQVFLTIEQSFLDNIKTE